MDPINPRQFDTDECKALGEALARVNAWIVNADQKCQGLMTASALTAALVAFVYSVVSKGSGAHRPFAEVALAVAFGASTLGAGFAVVGLTPVLSFLDRVRGWFKKTESKLERSALIGSTNPLFFGDVAQLSLGQFVGSWPKTGDMGRFVAEQVHTNSRVALSKYHLVRWSARCLALSLAALLASIIGW